MYLYHWTALNPLRQIIDKRPHEIIIHRTDGSIIHPHLWKVPKQRKQPDIPAPPAIKLRGDATRRPRQAPRTEEIIVIYIIQSIINIEYLFHIATICIDYAGILDILIIVFTARPAIPSNHPQLASHPAQGSLRKYTACDIQLPLILSIMFSNPSDRPTLIDFSRLPRAEHLIQNT